MKVFVEEQWTHRVCAAASLQRLYQRLLLQSSASQGEHLDWLLGKNLKFHASFQHPSRVSEDLTCSSGDIKSQNQRYLSVYFAGPGFFLWFKMVSFSRAAIGMVWHKSVRKTCNGWQLVSKIDKAIIKMSVFSIFFCLICVLSFSSSYDIVNSVSEKLWFLHRCLSW